MNHKPHFAHRFFVVVSLRKLSENLTEEEIHKTCLLLDTDISVETFEDTVKTISDDIVLDEMYIFKEVT